MTRSYSMKNKMSEDQYMQRYVYKKFMVVNLGDNLRDKAWVAGKACFVASRPR